MSSLSIEQLIEEKNKLLSIIQNIYSDEPLLRERNEIEISRNLILPTQVFVDNSARTCTDELMRKTADLQGVIESIEKIRDMISESDRNTRGEELKIKRRNRMEDRIRSISESFESEKGLVMEQSMYGVYASFYSKIAYVHNKLKHQDHADSWDSKQFYMRNAFAYALMGDVNGYRIRLDDEGTRCFLTPALIPIQGCENPVELHFGNDENYRRFIDETDSRLSTFATERPDLAYKAKLKLRYLNIQSQIGRDEYVPTYLKEPEIESDKEKAQLAIIKYCDLKTRYEKEKNKYLSTNKQYRREEFFQRMQELQSKLCASMRELMGLSVKDKQFAEYVESMPTISGEEEERKRLIRTEIPELLKIRTKRDTIEFLKKYPDEVGMIKHLLKGDRDGENLLGLLQDLQLEKSDEKKSKLAEKLVDRCVGIGTAGDNPFFVQAEGEKTIAEQIGDFIKSQGIDLPDLDTQIQTAIDDKVELEADEWNLGTEPLTNESFLHILKNGMREHGYELIDITGAIESYKKLDRFYGRDEDGVIDIYRWKAEKVLSEDHRR